MSLTPYKTFHFIEQVICGMLDPSTIHKLIERVCKILTHNPLNNLYCQARESIEVKEEEPAATIGFE
jgi:hypothetical protein